MACCRCNRSGYCKGCACVNCLPSRLGRCANLSSTTNDLNSNIHSSLTDATTASQNPPCAPSICPDRHLFPQQSTTSTFDSDSESTIDSESDINYSNHSIPNSQHHILPDFSPMESQSFLWGNVCGADFSALLNKTYAEVVHWRCNCFSIPSSKAGTDFVKELSRLYSA